MNTFINATLVFFLVFSGSLAAQAPDLACDHPDFAALETFYFATGGEEWDRADSWMVTCEPCSWYGIRCDANGRVTALVLPGNNLVGNLPPAIGGLTFLETFSAPDNALSGPLPASLFELDLWDVFLNNNQLSGTLPDAIGNLEFLQYLRLSGNNFSGELPTTLANLGKLRQLRINDNNFSGSFPAGFGVGANLTVLLASNNAFRGCLPEDLVNRCGNSNFRFDGNAGLPWSGEFSDFCANSFVADQVGAPCDDGDPETLDDTINENCDCGPQPDGFADNDPNEIALDQSGNIAPDDGQASPGNDGDASAGAVGSSPPTGNSVTTFPGEMTVYPNPVATGQLTITLPGNEGQAALRLLSVTGSVVNQRSFAGASVQLQVPSLAPGMYLVEAVAEGIRTVRRVMVE